MRTIEVLSKYGIFEVLIDDEDFERVNQYNWFINKNGKTFYVVRNVKTNGKKTKQPLHRFILYMTDSKILVDHIDGNGLNNCKDNLRTATHSQNSMNRGADRDNTTGFKGVFWHKRDKKFMAQITFNRKQIFLGYFSTAEEASTVYEAKAKELFGEFYKNNR